MAVPKKKLSRTRSGKRRSHLALKPINLGKCKKCDELKLPHTICPNCGTYNDDQVIDFTKKDKKTNKEA